MMFSTAFILEEYIALHDGLNSSFDLRREDLPWFRGKEEDKRAAWNLFVSSINLENTGCWTFTSPIIVQYTIKKQFSMSRNRIRKTWPRSNKISLTLYLSAIESFEESTKSQN